MYWFSEKLIWAPLYAVLLFLVWLQYKKAFWVILPLVILLVTLTDQVSVVFFKDVFERLRPCHEPALEGMVRILNGHCGGSYGFISSHASNTFGVATFVGLLLRQRYQWLLPAMLTWAGLVSYSRIYLGVHYPGDIIVGGIVGCLIGLLLIAIFRLILKKFPKLQRVNSQKTYTR
jgi:undecaprenyl-diphosphatase